MAEAGQNLPQEGRLIECSGASFKPTGSIYLHCDPTASHYLKLLMDAVFGQHNFLNEITLPPASTVLVRGMGSSGIGLLSKRAWRALCLPRCGQEAAVPGGASWRQGRP